MIRGMLSTGLTLCLAAVFPTRVQTLQAHSRGRSVPRPAVIAAPAAPVAEAGEPVSPFRLPFAAGKRVRIPATGHFGAERSYGPHSGLDFSLPMGTPIHPTRPGRVILARPFELLRDWRQGYGGLVIVRHIDGTRTWYAHLDRVDVRAGQVVGRGTVLGLSGGEDNGSSAGPHLHFMVFDRRGEPRDPEQALSAALRKGRPPRL